MLELDARAVETLVNRLDNAAKYALGTTTVSILGFAGPGFP